jgi:predicted amidohydrolase YtcJ
MADLVLFHGKILTMDPARPQVEALAAKGDTIVFAGSNDKVQSHIGADTQVIDLEGQLAIPGFIDGHGHYMSLGDSLMGVDLFHTRTWDEVVSRATEAAKGMEPGEWIVGRGWHQGAWDQPPSPAVKGLPTHQSLSEATPQNPAILIHSSGHGVFVNQRALELAGISRETPDPVGGEILRDEQGNPTGMLREIAQQPARDALARHRAQRPPEAVEARLRRQVKLAADEAISKGVTSFHDMGETFEMIDLYKKMAEEGNLPVRLYVCVQEPSEVMEHKLADYRMVGYGNNYLTVRAIGEKVLDGAMGVHGGWLLEPYSDAPDSTGFIVNPVSEIQRSAELAIQHGYQMAIQGIGDRAARELLNIYQAAFGPEKQDLRWRIEHCQVIHPDDLPRFARLGVIASVRGVFATSDGPWVIERLGKERIHERGYQYQTLIQSGAVLMSGTDPPVEDIDPIANFYALVTRKMEDGAVFFPGQKLTRQQALESYTINNAFAAFEEDVKGALTPGKLADITVLSQDIMTVPDEEILDTKVVYTIIGGEVKYTRPA